MHLYLMLDCKTPGCEMKHLVRYVGEGEPVPGFVSVHVPNFFPVACPECRNSHDYQSDDLRQAELDAPPPRDFQNAF